MLFVFNLVSQHPNDAQWETLLFIRSLNSVGLQPVNSLEPLEPA